MHLHRTDIGIHINCAYCIMPAVLYGLLSPRMTSQKKNIETYDITALEIQWIEDGTSSMVSLA